MQWQLLKSLVSLVPPPQTVFTFPGQTPATKFVPAGVAAGSWLQLQVVVVTGVNAQRAGPVSVAESGDVFHMPVFGQVKLTERQPPLRVLTVNGPATSPWVLAGRLTVVALPAGAVPSVQTGMTLAI